MSDEREPDQIFHQLLETLCRLPPTQFEVLVTELSLPHAYLPGAAAAQATRAVEIVRYLHGQGQLEILAKRLWHTEHDERLCRYPSSLVEELDRLTRARHTPPPHDTPAAADERQHRIDTIVAELKRRGSPGMGDVVLRVRLDRIVGKGNFGVVWQGIDERTGEARAIKVFDSDRLGLELALVHFRRGVTAMAHLQKARDRPPSVVQLFDSEDTRIAFSMPYLEGGSLAHVHRQGWDLDKKLRVFRAICEATKFAHDNKVIHRDIKPTNIVMSSFGTPVLTDFDIADLLFVQTMSAQPGGAACYAAPEQLHQDDLQAPSAPTADVYSLGRLLYYLLLERDPQLRFEEVPRLEDLAQKPEGLVRIIRKCTMRAPHDRYASVAALLRDLDRCSSAPQSVGRGLSRPRAWQTWTLLGIVSVIAAIAWSSPSGPQVVTGPRQLDEPTVKTTIPTEERCSDYKDDSINIGSYFSEAGLERNFGLSSRHGVDLAVNRINESGDAKGIRLTDGRRMKLNLIRRDDRGSPTAATQYVREFIDCGALAVVGEVKSALSIVGGDLCEKAGVPMISPSSTSERVTKGRNYVFRACFTNELQGSAMAQFMFYQLDLKKAAVFTDERDDRKEYSDELANAFKRKLEELGGKVVATESYDGGKPGSFSEQLKRLAHSRPDTLYIPGYYDEVAKILQMLPEQFDPMIPVLGGDGWESVANEANKVPKLAAYFTSHFHIDAKRSVEDQREVDWFVGAYKKLCSRESREKCFEGDTPNALAALGYDSVMLLKEAIERAPTDKNLARWRTNVQKAIRGTASFHGLTGNISFSGVNHRSVVVLEVDSGKEGGVSPTKFHPE